MPETLWQVRGLSQSLTLSTTSCPLAATSHLPGPGIPYADPELPQPCKIDTESARLCSKSDIYKRYVIYMQLFNFFADADVTPARTKTSKGKKRSRDGVDDTENSQQDPAIVRRRDMPIVQVKGRKARSCKLCRRADCGGRWMGNPCEFPSQVCYTGK